MEEATAATLDAEAPAASSGDSSQSEAPQGDFDSVASAFAAFERDQAAQLDGESEDASAASDDDTDSVQSGPATGDAPEPSTDTPKGRLYSEQAALDRALSLHRAGRTHELPPEVQGQIRKWESDTITRHLAEQKEESEFRQMYLDYLATAEEDPAKFAAMVRDQTPIGEGMTQGRAIVEFMDSYQRAHPDISLENPNPGPKAKSEAEIRGEYDQMQRESLNHVLAAYCEDNGVTNFDSLRESASGQGNILVAVTDAVANAKVKRLTDTIRKQEREAARKEVQAEYGALIPSLSVSSSGVSASAPRGRDPQSVAEAMRMFEEEMREA